MINLRNEKTPTQLKVYISFDGGEEVEHVFSKEWLDSSYFNMDAVKKQVFTSFFNLKRFERIKIVNHLVGSVNDYKRNTHTYEKL